MFFFFKKKTAYEIYQCDWSSDVCSSDLEGLGEGRIHQGLQASPSISPQWARSLVIDPRDDDTRAAKRAGPSSAPEVPEKPRLFVTDCNSAPSESQRGPKV